MENENKDIGLPGENEVSSSDKTPDAIENAEYMPGDKNGIDNPENSALGTAENGEAAQPVSGAAGIEAIDRAMNKAMENNGIEAKNAQGLSPEADTAEFQAETPAEVQREIPSGIPAAEPQGAPVGNPVGQPVGISAGTHGYEWANTGYQPEQFPGAARVEKPEWNSPVNPMDTMGSNMPIGKGKDYGDVNNPYARYKGGAPVENPQQNNGVNGNPYGQAAYSPETPVGIPTGYPTGIPTGIPTAYPGYQPGAAAPVTVQGAVQGAPGYQPNYSQGYPQNDVSPYYPNQQVYPYGAQPEYSPQPPYMKNPPAPKKMGRGIKVFLWILGVLSVMTIGGFIVFLAVSDKEIMGPVYTRPDNPADNYSDQYDDYYSYLLENDEKMREAYDKYGYLYEEFGDFLNDYYYGAFDDIDPENEDALPDINKVPDVAVEPNHDGITVNTKPEGSELTAEEIYDKLAPSTVTVGSTRITELGESTTTGTGIIATSDGYIITNSHVVFDSKSTKVKITTFDEKEYDAVVVGVDRSTDVAILKTNDYGFTAAEFGDADELKIGEWVMALGNPGGAKFSSSFTRGIISGLNRTVGEYSENGMTYIQTDAAINPGNSGGPLINMYGQVVGINSSKIITSGYEGMGFAIPVSKAKQIINELLAGGYVKGRTRLGITGTDVTEVEYFASGIPAGFKIATIEEGSAFDGTDTKVGDVITAIEGEEVTGISSVANCLLKYKPGDKVKVTVYRPSESESHEVEIVLLEDKGETQR